MNDMTHDRERYYVPHLDEILGCGPTKRTVTVICLKARRSPSPVTFKLDLSRFVTPPAGPSLAYRRLFHTSA